MNTSLGDLIDGSEKLTAVFGRWPRFHDAEVVELYLECGNLDPEAEIFEAPSLSLKVAMFDESGALPFEHMTVATLYFEGLEAVALGGFTNQNVLMGISIVPTHYDETTVFDVQLTPNDGMLGSWKCSSILVVEVATLQRGEPVPKWMDFKFRMPKESADRWNRLESALLSIPIPPFARSPVSFQTLRQTPRSNRAALMIEKYHPLAPAASNAIRTYFQTGSLPSLTAEEYHVAWTIRSYAVGEITRISWANPDNVVPCPRFPQMSVQAMAIQMVTRWWDQVGWGQFLGDVESRADECLKMQFSAEPED